MSDDLEAIIGYGMTKIADVRMPNRTTLSITITDKEAAAQGLCIYAFLMGGKIGRIGSCKGPLRLRMKETERLVSGRLREPLTSKFRRPTIEEAELWLQLLEEFAGGAVYARPGTQVTTPIGTFPAYLDEEKCNFLVATGRA